MTNNIFIATLGDEQKFMAAYASLEAAVKGCKEFILRLSYEAWVNFVDIHEESAVVDGTAVIQPMNEPAEWYEFSFEIKKVEVLS